MPARPTMSPRPCAPAARGPAGRGAHRNRVRPRRQRRRSRGGARDLRRQGRPTDHPLIVHLADAAAMPRWARDIPAEAWARRRVLAGPLTLLLHRHPDAPAEVAAGARRSACGYRRTRCCARHPCAGWRPGRALGQSPTAPARPPRRRCSQTWMAASTRCSTAAPCTVGLESTIVDLTGTVPRSCAPVRSPARNWKRRLAAGRSPDRARDRGAGQCRRCTTARASPLPGDGRGACARAPPRWRPTRASRSLPDPALPVVAPWHRRRDPHARPTNRAMRALYGTLHALDALGAWTRSGGDAAAGRGLARRPRPPVARRHPEVKPPPAQA